MKKSLLIFNCLSCPHYDIPEDFMLEYITECALSSFNRSGKCPCTKCSNKNDCSEWCWEYYEFKNETEKR